MPKIKDGLYALYLRKSRADLEKEQYGEFETLAIHQGEMTAFAKREGYVLDEPYYRELVSGERISERHEFQKLMNKVEGGAYRGILVHEVSRLGRGDPMEYGWILFTLKRTRTLIVTPFKVYDPNNQSDARSLQMEMFVSNMELGSIVDRLVNGCRGSAERGRFIKPTPPYGYNRIMVNGKWTLEQNEDAPTVRMIFERAASGDPLGTIAREMNEAGLRTQSGKFWGASRLNAILSNPHYKGMIRYGYYKQELVPGEGFTVKKKQTINDNYILVNGLHEGIVDEELWQAANDRNHGSAPVKRSRELKNPLAGLLVCKKCGRAMKRFMNTSRSNGNKNAHYRHAPFCDCNAQGAPLGIVVSILCDALEEIAHDFEIVDEVGKADTTEQELHAIEMQLTREANKLEKLIELYYAEAITIDEFKSRRAASEELQETLKVRAAELLVEKPMPKQVAATVREAIVLLRDDDVPAQKKNTALKSFVERIEYENFTVPRSRKYDVRLTVVMRFRPNAMLDQA